MTSRLLLVMPKSMPYLPIAILVLYHPWTRMQRHVSYVLANLYMRFAMSWLRILN